MGSSVRESECRYTNKNRKEGKYKLNKLKVLCSIVCVLCLLGGVLYQNGIIVFRTDKTKTSVENKRTKKDTQEDFSRFIQQVFIDEVTDNSITLNYTLKNKSLYGIEETEPSLGEAGLDGMRDSLFVSENRLASLETFEYKKLTDEQQLIYDIMKDMLKQNLEASDMLEYSECLGVTSGIQAQLPILLAEYNFYKKEDIDTYLSLLKLIPDYFEKIIKFERQKSKAGLFMSDTTAQAIIDQCKGFVNNKSDNYLIKMFNSKIKGFKNISEEEMSSYKDTNKQEVLEYVIPAYESLIDILTSLKGTGVNPNGLCGFEKGKKYYEYLVRTKTGSERSINDINEMLDKNIKQTSKYMSKMITDSPDAYYESQNVEYPYSSPEKSIGHLRKVIKKDFPELSDNISCDIKYVDKSLQDSLSPAFYLTSAIDNYENNIIYINNSSKYDLSKIFTTIAHESYPGHLYQNCYFASTNPSPVRSIINIDGYTEGWGTYAELYGYYLAGLDKKVAEILEKNTIATLCLYAKADIGVNYLGWHFSELEKYLKEYGFSASQSRIIFDSMVAEPASYMPYTLGYLEIADIKKEAMERLGADFILKDFHKFILSTGPAPFSIIRKRLNTWIDDVQKSK